MTLSIKDPETDRLARKLSILTGETLAETITNSLKERLERMEHNLNVHSSLDEIYEISRRFREKIQQSISSLDHGDELYNEDGMPD
ncbi:type II toxin-antitoxin system VapB family antitoxin [Leptospira alstonii]|uniref:Ribbon-helix-helix transcription factor family protein n=3 Tax=Leptospira alstonii TaxID=28452 RepID=M6CRX9_9LEPT|nr:type II toxin-antitoxin system VapB family antitoxin [Leptospira alstonii]EMJ94444.1 ribbon-helix-helix transcription factor family protein [Leptospira alstonii serovar Sichuan str. 79601]EQA82562.1 ribbon-helix-helix transcription factor family protein [Leptospira alstonii serovar Pingchang str. 80-412]